MDGPLSDLDNKFTSLGTEYDMENIEHIDDLNIDILI